MSLLLYRFAFTLLFLFRWCFRFRFRFRFLFPFPFLFRIPVSCFSRRPVNVVYLQCSVPCCVNLLALTVFQNICFPFFLYKLTSISRLNSLNWSCEGILEFQGVTCRPKSIIGKLVVRYLLIDKFNLFIKVDNHKVLSAAY